MRYLIKTTEQIVSRVNNNKKVFLRKRLSEKLAVIYFSVFSDLTEEESFITSKNCYEIPDFQKYQKTYLEIDFIRPHGFNEAVFNINPDLQTKTMFIDFSLSDEESQTIEFLLEKDEYLFNIIKPLNG